MLSKIAFASATFVVSTQAVALMDEEPDLIALSLA